MSVELVKAPAPWVERMEIANKMLAEIADDPFRASRVWDYAEAARVYAIQMQLGVDAVNHAVAVKLKAQRLLADAVDRGQDQGRIRSNGQSFSNSSRSEGEREQIRTLGEILGREPSTARRIVSESRKIRDAFSEDDIDVAAADACSAGEELSSARMLRVARGGGNVRTDLPASVGDRRTLGRTKSPTFILRNVAERLDGTIPILDSLDISEVDADEAAELAESLSTFRAALSKTINQLRSRA